MEAIRLHAPGIEGLRHETIRTSSLQVGEALVEVQLDPELAGASGDIDLRSVFRELAAR